MSLQVSAMVPCKGSFKGSFNKGSVTGASRGYRATEGLYLAVLGVFSAMTQSHGFPVGA